MAVCGWKVKNPVTVQFPRLGASAIVRAKKKQILFLVLYIGCHRKVGSGLKVGLPTSREMD